MDFGRRPRLLIADDDADLQGVLKHLTELEGYEVLQAFDGRQALNLTRETEPDILLMDICMPYLDGRDVLSALKANPCTSEIPVLMCSARHEARDRALATKLGAADYIDKPFDFRLLLSKLTALLRTAPDTDPPALRSTQLFF